MNEVTRAVDEVKALYERVVGQPAPEIEPGSFVPFPPGVDPVRHALDEVNLVKQLAARIASAPTPISWVPLADVFAQGNDVVIQLEIPGVEREDLTVFVAQTEVVVRGQRKPAIFGTGGQPLALERANGAFERRFPIPPGSPREVTAAYTDGMLELRLAAKSNGPTQEVAIEIS